MSEHYWRDKVRVLYSPQAINERIAALAAQIRYDLADSEPVVIGILKGSFVFMADLVRQLDLPVSCDFIAISSYGDGTHSSGVVQITRDLSQSIEGRDVLVVEDIIDTGLTMEYLLANLRTRRPRSVRVCTLLHKIDNARVKVSIDYVGFAIPNEFVVGYGLDYAGRFRNLPFIGVYDAGA